MPNNIIEREIGDIRAQVDKIHRRTNWWLKVLTISLVLFFVIPFLIFLWQNPSSYPASWVFILFLTSIFFGSLAIYLTSLLRKPQFTVLYINKKANTVSAIEASNPKGVAQRTPVRISLLIYFAITTGFWVLVVPFSCQMLMALLFWI